MPDQVAVQTLLTEKLAEAKLRNPNFSLRAFARKLGLNSGAVSGILAGKRRVSRKMAIRIADQLCLDPQERAALFALATPAAKGASGLIQYESLGVDQFRLISDWYHFGILSLQKTKDFKPEARWIARRLGITVRDAEGALERLLRLGMLVRKGRKLERAKPQYRTSDDVAEISLRKAHATNLDLARASLDRDPITERDFTAVTMAIDPARLPEAKERVRAFQDSLSDFLESGERAEVYKMSIQLFPLSRKGE